MVRSGFVRFFGAPLVALDAALAVAPGPVMAAEPARSVTVDPQTAVGGGVFTFEDGVCTTPEAKLPALFYLIVVGFGLTGGAFLSRRLEAARSGSRH